MSDKSIKKIMYAKQREEIRNAVHKELVERSVKITIVDEDT